MSTFKCEVVPVKLEPHPNADTLSIVKVWGYTVVVKTEDWKDQTSGVYIPPDSIVPLDNPMFDFLQGRNRITVRRFRGVYSQGLLMPVPRMTLENAVNGDYYYYDGHDFAEEWGITHYEPEIQYDVQGNKKNSFPPVPGPPGMVIPKYDVENFNRYAPCIPDGMPVYVTEKIHGTNARFVYASLGSTRFTQEHMGYKMYAGSRSTWKHDGSAIEGRNTEYTPTDPWWNCIRQNPWIEEWCREHPNMVLYGEVYGQVQDLKYGAANGQLWFKAFDVLDNGRWLNYSEFEGLVLAEHRVPVVFLGPMDEKLVREIAERDSVVCPGQLSEGVVVCPLIEQTHLWIGRVQLKVVSNRYLEKSK